MSIEIHVMGKSGKLYDRYTGKRAAAVLDSLRAACFKRQASGLMVQIRRRPVYRADAVIRGLYYVPASERLTCRLAADAVK